MIGKIKTVIEKFGLPRIIIFFFLITLFILAPIVGVRLDISINDVIVRFGMNGILVLSLIPMVRSGCGLNFGLQLGVIAGLLGAVISIELNATGFAGFFVAIAVSLFFALILGFLYGILLNKVKGDEMVVATYVGFSAVSFMCILWLLLPFKNPSIIWPYGGEGLRTTISNQDYWFNILTNFLQIKVGEYIVFPTGTILFFIFLTAIVWLFFRSKIGTAMIAVGSNPDFAKSCGVNVDNMRIISVVLSTVIAAIGIIVYQESFGFIQLYMAPLYMPFPAIAALLIGGATVGKASFENVIIGVFLFQGIITMTPSIINNIFKSDMSEVVRIIVSNGMIVYALTRITRGRS